MGIDEIQSHDERIQELERRIDRLNKDVDRLASYIEILVSGIRLVEHSRTWRVGKAIVHNAKRFIGRPNTLTFFRDTDELCEVFDHWKKSRD